MDMNPSKSNRSLRIVSVFLVEYAPDVWGYNNMTSLRASSNFDPEMLKIIWSLFAKIKLEKIASDLKFLKMGILILYLPIS